ncbi:hypothetical protein DFH29DRAFT_259437 [Suillus ampliporus]|nr:hypothetical protein DFH29DRAFT_259437 [Suillus ampliporus]
MLLVISCLSIFAAIARRFIYSFRLFKAQVKHSRIPQIYFLQNRNHTFNLKPCTRYFRSERVSDTIAWSSPGVNTEDIHISTHRAEQAHCAKTLHISPTVSEICEVAPPISLYSRL